MLMLSSLTDYALLCVLVLCLFVVTRHLSRFVQGLFMRKDMIGVDIQEETSITRYFVKNYTNKEDSAALLSVTRQKLFKLLTHIRNMHDRDIPPDVLRGVRRMVNRHCHDIKLSELDVSIHAVVAFNRGKGDHIYVCLRECPTCSKLTAEDGVFVVALHELSHTCMKRYEPSEGGVTKHGPEFRRYERYIAELAQSIHLVRLDQVIGANYCDITIPDFINEDHE